jgi:hypothetical protein
MWALLPIVRSEAIMQLARIGRSERGSACDGFDCATYVLDSLPSI